MDELADADERGAAAAVAELLEAQRATYDTYIEGLEAVIEQPEFSSSERMLEAVRHLMAYELARPLALVANIEPGSTHVVIGSENEDAWMQEWSVVASGYGDRDGPAGTVAVLGPMRMHYARTIPRVRYVRRADERPRSRGRRPMTQPGTDGQPEVAAASDDAEAGGEAASEEVAPDEAASDEPAPDETAPDEEQWRQLRAELEELRAQHARAVADYQNLRRRQAEERREHARLTEKALVLSYLPVLDDLNRALDAVAEHEELAEHQWVDGVRMVQRKFLGVLEAGGVEQIEADGCAFDPELHEAVSYQRGPEGRVVAVVQNGYSIDGLVIRPAMVLVGDGEDATEEATEDATDEGADEGAGEDAAEAMDEATDNAGAATTRRGSDRWAE